MNTTAAEPLNQRRPPTGLADLETQHTELKRRQDWIVQQADTLLSPDTPFTRKGYGQKTTSDTDMLGVAGATTPARGTGGWSSEIVLLNSWQILSGFAYARPWSLSLGSNIVVRDPEPNPTTGTITVSAERDPDRLLHFAFRAP